MFHLLPLLKGWAYKAHHAERKAVIRGAPPLELLRISETGWLFVIDLLTNDAYGTAIIEFQDADLQTQSATIYPKAAEVLGAWAQDPSGWVQKYFRPNPNSTEGIYYLTYLTGGYQGALFPYVPTVVVKLALGSESTQETAFVSAGAGVIAITDKKAFIRSLRRVLDAKASLKIAPALLVPGPREFKELKL